MTATVGCDTWEDHLNASATATADTGRWAPAPDRHLDRGWPGCGRPRTPPASAAA